MSLSVNTEDRSSLIPLPNYSRANVSAFFGIVAVIFNLVNVGTTLAERIYWCDSVYCPDFENIDTIKNNLNIASVAFSALSMIAIFISVGATCCLRSGRVVSNSSQATSEVSYD